MRRIFSHPNVMPVIGCCNSPPNLVVISQYAPLGSLYQVLHENSSGLVVDSARAVQFALDIAKGMAFMHSLERDLPRFHLNSKHVMVRRDHISKHLLLKHKAIGELQIDHVSDEEVIARVNMADARFSFQERGKHYQPQWSSPESLLKSPAETNTRAADMWSFAVLLWEMAAREPPFPDLSPMEAGMRVS